MTGNYEILKLLLDAGAEVNKPNSFSQTPFIVCFTRLEEVSGFEMRSGEERVREQKDLFQDGGVDSAVRGRHKLDRGQDAWLHTVDATVLYPDDAESTGGGDKLPNNQIPDRERGKGTVIWQGT